MYPMDTISQVQVERKTTEGTSISSYLKPSNLTIRIDLVPWHTSGFE